MSISFPDLSLTAYPDGQDPYKIFVDVNASNVSYVEQIRTCLDNHDFDGAKAVFNAHPELNNVIATATMFQLFEDQIIAMERFYKSNVVDVISHIVTYDGNYSSSATYQIFHSVSYSGKVYMCISDTEITNILPTDTNNWILVTLQGPAGTGLAPYTSWDNTLTYNDLAVVPYANKLYLSLQENNLNHQPDINPDWWKIILLSPTQIITSETQPTGQDENGYWFQKNSSDNSFKVMKSDGNNGYSQLYPASNASLIKTSDGNNVQNFIDSKGQSNGVAPLGSDGLVPKEYLNLNFSGKLIVHVTSSDGGSVTGTRVRIRNEQLGSNYVQDLDALANTTFSLLDNHIYYVVLLDYPATYYGAAATVQITGGETQTLTLTLKTTPDIVGWREKVTTGEVEYIEGATDFQPMSVTDGTTDFGSWGENWICDMRPCLLKNGVVQYYLKQTGTLTFDYTKQANGTASDITSGDDGDVMIEFPRVYYKFFDETDSQGVHWIGCKYSKTPADDTWCCNAWLNKNGVPQEVMYMSAYDGEIYNSKLRSLSGVTPTVSQTIGAFRTAANSNGSGYEQQEWSKRVYIQSLLPMLFKGLDSQALVGKGVSSAPNKINTGTMNDKPLFWGDQTGTDGVKFCGIENCWGNIWKFADGLITDGDGWHYKVFGPYNDAGSGYTDAGSVPSDLTVTYIDSMTAANGFGMLPKTSASDADAAKFHDYVYANNQSSLYFAYTSGGWDNGANDGAFYLFVHNTASGSLSNIGGALSYTPV